MASLDAEQEGTRPVVIRVLDGFAAESATGELIPIKNRKACGLLAYLALNPRKSETRERLAGLFWSDKSEEQARASLRQCLKQLRGLLPANGEPAFRTERQEISLAPDRFGIDLQEIAEHLRRGAIGDELIYGRVAPERILYGLESLDQAFGAWLHVVRERWQHRLVDVLETYLRDSDADAATRERAAQALVQLDSTHEEAQRHLIRRFAEKGNTSAALKQYNELWDLLGAEYDMEPAEETQQLIAEIKSGAFPPAGQTHGLAAAAVAAVVPRETTSVEPVRRPVLELGPFLPGDPVQTDAYLIDGFRRVLIASLVRFRDWVVVDGRRSGSHSNTTTSPDGGVNYRIEGTYFEDQGGVNLVITLMDVATRQYIWSERYALTLESWSVAQRQIVMRMSAGLNVQVSAQYVAQHIADPEISTDAYNLWLQGYHLIWSWDPAVRNKAETMFRQVIEASPGFAPAYSGLASIYSSRHMISPGLLPDRSMLEEATRFAQTSVALDPLDVRSQVALAWSNAMIGRYEQAALHHRLAYDLNPNNPTTLFSCANGLSMYGDVEAGVRLSREAIQLSPIINPGQWAYLASTRFICGDYVGCVEAADLAEDVIPVTPGWRVAALGHLGWRERAAAAAEHFLDVTRRRWVGNQPYDEARAVKWFLQHCPVKNLDPRTRAQEGMTKAGLPVPR